MSMVRRIMKVRTTAFRIILSSGIGALGACLVILWPVFPRILGTFTGRVRLLAAIMVKTGLHNQGNPGTGQRGAWSAFCHGDDGGYHVRLISAYANRILCRTADSRQWTRRAASSDLACVWQQVPGLDGKYLWILALETKKRQQNLYQVMLCCRENTAFFYRAFGHRQPSP